MADWEDLHHFVTLAREGTLSAAARVLRVDHATVARRVAALEQSTGLKLVDRRSRTTVLTDDGKRIAAVATPMEEAAFAVGRAAQAAKPGVDGEVSISAPPNFAPRGSKPASPKSWSICPIKAVSCCAPASAGTQILSITSLSLPISDRLPGMPTKWAPPSSPTIWRLRRGSGHPNC